MTEPVWIGKLPGEPRVQPGDSQDKLQKFVKMITRQGKAPNVVGHTVIAMRLDAKETMCSMTKLTDDEMRDRVTRMKTAEHVVTKDDVKSLEKPLDTRIRENYVLELAFDWPAAKQASTIIVCIPRDAFAKKKKKEAQNEMKNETKTWRIRVEPAISLKEECSDAEFRHATTQLLELLQKEESDFPGLQGHVIAVAEFGETETTFAITCNEKFNSVVEMVAKSTMANQVGELKRDQDIHHFRVIIGQWPSSGADKIARIAIGCKKIE